MGWWSVGLCAVSEGGLNDDPSPRRGLCKIVAVAVLLLAYVRFGVVHTFVAADSYCLDFGLAQRLEFPGGASSRVPREDSHAFI